jgi:hypothetical protein
LERLQYAAHCAFTFSTCAAFQPPSLTRRQTWSLTTSARGATISCAGEALPKRRPAPHFAFDIPRWFGVTFARAFKSASDVPDDLDGSKECKRSDSILLCRRDHAQ